MEKNEVEKATDLETYIENVLKFTAQGTFVKLVEFAHYSMECLTKNSANLDNVIQAFDIKHHTIGILYVLIVKFKTAEAVQVATMPMLLAFQEFVRLCNIGQVRIAAYAFFELCHQFTNFIIDKPQCHLAIKLLATAIERFCIKKEELTPLHADLCQVSLKATNFKLVLKYLNVDKTSIACASDTLKNVASHEVDGNYDAKYFLLYYYYGGMIYTAIEKYDEGLYYFEACIATPATVASAIVVEAFKKYVLVSLIKNGKVQSLIKCPPTNVLESISSVTKEYLELEKVYRTMQPEKLKLLMQKHADVYCRDKNMGLVKKVLCSLYKNNLLRLTKTFVMLSLENIAERLKIPTAGDAEAFLLRMIKAGEINACINQKDGTVYFKENYDDSKSCEMLEKIHDNIDNVTNMVRKIKTMDEEILLDHEYIKKVMEGGNVPGASVDDELRSHQAK